MKKANNFKNINKIVVPILLIIVVCSGFLLFQQPSSIVGTWILKEDSKSKWVFTENMKLKIYYDNEVIDTFTYDISRASPKCGKNIETEISKRPKLEFLELTELNSGYQNCYYVFGIDKENLSLKPFNGGEFLLFKRQ